MSDTPKETTKQRRVGPRAHHVVAHVAATDAAAYDEILVFGTELDALRHIVGKAGWEYRALANGQVFEGQS